MKISDNFEIIVFFFSMKILVVLLLMSTHNISLTLSLVMIITFLSVKIKIFYYPLTTTDRRRSKTLILSMNVETEFLVIFELHSLIVKSIFDCHLSRVLILTFVLGSQKSCLIVMVLLSTHNIYFV